MYSTSVLSILLTIIVHGSSYGSYVFKCGAVPFAELHSVCTCTYINNSVNVDCTDNLELETLPTFSRRLTSLIHLIDMKGTLYCQKQLLNHKIVHCHDKGM